MVFSTPIFAAGGDMGLATEPLTDGSDAYPYLIEDFTDFEVFADPANSATYWAIGVHTKLMVDIDLSGRTYTTAVIATGTDATLRYNGLFDGNDHSVSNLTITAGASMYYLGLFGYINGTTSVNGEIKNLSLIDCSITAGDNSSLVGSLCGLSYGTINNCYSSGSITAGIDSGNLGGLCGYQTCYYGGSMSDSHSSVSVTGGKDSQSIGGLCGTFIYGNLSNCYATGAVAGDNTVGGLCGSISYESTISDCYASGQVVALDLSDYGSSNTGGLCGYSYTSTIINCYATGSVNGADEYGREERLGGLCGYNHVGSAIINCYATGAIIGGAQKIGGLCGENYNGTISNSYSTSSINCGMDSLYVGGLCGYNRNDGTFTNCYSTGSINCGMDSHHVGGMCGINDSGTFTNCYSASAFDVSGSVYRIGGLCGYTNTGTFVNSFWDIQLSGRTSSDGGIGETTANMQTQSTFTSVGWDFNSIWRMCTDGVEYPRLLWEFSAADFVCPNGVNLVDFAVLADTWNLSSGETGYNDVCDLVTNGTIDLADLALFTNYWLD